MFFADVVVCDFQELVRKGNKLNKLIANALLYVVFVDNGKIICWTFDLHWTKTLKFPKETESGA